MWLVSPHTSETATNPSPGQKGTDASRPLMSAHSSAGRPLILNLSQEHGYQGCVGSLEGGAAPGVREVEEAEEAWGWGSSVPDLGDLALALLVLGKIGFLVFSTLPVLC